MPDHRVKYLAEPLLLKNIGEHPAGLRSSAIFLKPRGCVGGRGTGKNLEISSADAGKFCTSADYLVLILLLRFVVIHVLVITDMPVKESCLFELGLLSLRSFPLKIISIK